MLHAISMPLVDSIRRNAQAEAEEHERQRHTPPRFALLAGRVLVVVRHIGRGAASSASLHRETAKRAMSVSH